MKLVFQQRALLRLLAQSDCAIMASISLGLLVLAFSATLDKVQRLTIPVAVLLVQNKILASQVP